MDFCYNGVYEDIHKNRKNPMRPFDHLTLDKREKLTYFRAQNNSISEIAALLQRSKST